MKNYPIFYEESRKLCDALMSVPEDKHEELSKLLGFDYTPELFNDITLALMALDKLLSAYVQVSDDLKELQEMSE